jgi:hypothetical protein
MPFALLALASGQVCYARTNSQADTQASPAPSTITADSAAQQAPAPPWPRVVHSGNKTLTVYEPQPETWDGTKLTARAPVAVQQEGGEASATRYGSVHFTARTDVDKAQGLVSLHDVRIVSADFPADPSHTGEYQRAIANTGELTSVIPLARIQAGVEATRAARAPGRDSIRNSPPEVIHTERPSLLVLVDGPPQLRPIEGTSLSRVVNTRALIVRGATSYWLYIADRWLQSSAIEGPWSEVTAANPELDRAKDAVTNAGLVGSGEIDLLGSSANIDRNVAVYVRTRPAELLETSGSPELAPVQGTHLWYVTNTNRDVFLDDSSRRYFVLLSGRWFSAPSLNGSWQFVASNQLPADFARIPPSSAKGNALASVAGTPQAGEALIANQVPETASVPRQNGPTLDVRYDGSPNFAPIEDTSLTYATNTSTPVIAVNPSSYYALSDGVWFVGDSATGPWQIATSVPAAIYGIPTSSPLHYVTNVYIDGYTPDQVYVASTPGYLGTVVAPSGVVVYGTGYDYSPWIGSAWYGAPVTYGLGVGLAFGVGFGFGVGFYSPFVPWWGPRFVYPTYARPFYAHSLYAHPVYVNNYNVYNRWHGYGVVTRAPYAPGRAYGVGGGPPVYGGGRGYYRAAPGYGGVYGAAPAYRGPVYRTPPANGVTPAYRAPVYRAPPVYNASPAYRGPAYGAPPAYRAAPAVPAAPAYRPGAPPAYRAAPVAPAAPAYRPPAPVYRAPQPAARPMAPPAAPHPMAPMHAPPAGHPGGYGGPMHR